MTIHNQWTSFLRETSTYSTPAGANVVSHSEGRHSHQEQCRHGDAIILLRRSQKADYAGDDTAPFVNVSGRYLSIINRDGRCGVVGLGVWLVWFGHKYLVGFSRRLRFIVWGMGRWCFGLLEGVPKAIW